MSRESLDGDRLLSVLSVLPDEDAGAACVARLRARCHTELIRRRRRGQLAAFFADTGWMRVLEPVTVGAASAVFLAEVARRAAALLGL